MNEVTDRRCRDRRSRWALAAVVAVNLVSIVWSAAASGDGEFHVVRDGVLFHVAIVLPAILCAARARRERGRGLQWWLLMVTIVANAGAEATFTFHEQHLDPFPVPAWSDGWYLVSYLSALAATLVVTQRRVLRAPWAIRMDGLVFGLAVGAATAAIWFGPILRARGSIAESVVGLMLPLFDLALIVVLVAGLAPLRFRPTPAVSVLLVSMVLSTVSDVAYLRMLADDPYLLSPILEVIWQLLILGYGVAAVLPDTPRRDRDQPWSHELMALPALAALAAFVVLGFGVLGRVPLLASVLAMAALAAAIGRVVATAAELRRANHAFRQARTDELTGLLNRRGFAEHLDAVVAAGDGSADGVVVFGIDLNGFKEVNDTLGHQAGDRLLQVVAARYRSAVPAGVVVGRLGGDEFAVVVAPDAADPQQVADRLAASLDDPIALSGRTVRVGASIGMACGPADGTTREALLHAADVAMYEAKSTRQRVVRYAAERDPRRHDRTALLADLVEALRAGGIEVRFRPVVEVGSGTIAGIEAQAHWTHPGLGEAGHDLLIRLSERAGVSGMLSRLLFTSSVEQLATRPSRGEPRSVRVGLAPEELVHGGVAAELAAIAQARGVTPSQLVIGVSEAAVHAGGSRAEVTLRELRNHGFRLAVERFGAGASSMPALLRLPVDELVLDHSFLVAIEEDLGAQAVLAATVELGRRLGLAVLVEGVTTQAALDVVVRSGVHGAIGPLFDAAELPISGGPRPSLLLGER